jgi:polysaccharide chain length determinant protein (PEP-CTERM system associated)
MENGFGIEDILGIIRRRWFLPVITVAIGLPLSVAIAYLLPPVYQSSARILVESQQIPTDLVRSTVDQSTQERIALIRQRLLTRETLLQIADQYGVFADRLEMSPTDVVTEMREAVSLVGETARGRSRNVIGIDISFRARSPAIAARVANDLVDRVISQNAEARTERASGTRAYFDQEVARLTTEIEALSSQITAFKIENQGSLPNSLASRQGALTNLRERIFDREQQIAALSEERRALLEARETGVLPSGQARSPEEVQLERLRAQLRLERATLAESHPTIRQLNARIAALEASFSAQDQTGDAAITDEATNQVTALSRIDAQLETIDFRIGQLEQENAINLSRAAELERSIEATPETERALTRLEGNLDVLRVQLRDATLKRAEAEAGERLEASQQAERFEVVEQAIPIDEPVEPRRRRIIAAGTALSGLIGAGLMVLLEFLKPAIRSVRDLENRLGLRPIVAIPHIRLEAEHRRRRWLLRALAIAPVVIIAVVLVLVDQFFLPLPVLYEEAVSELGLDAILRPLGLAP